MRRGIPWCRANSELYEGHNFSQFMIAVCTHGAPESRVGALASELLNLNSHVERLMHGRNSISNKSLPWNSFLDMEIGDALSSLRRRINPLKTILESLWAILPWIFLSYVLGIDFSNWSCIFYYVLYLQEDPRTNLILSKIFRDRILQI